MHGVEQVLTLRCLECNSQLSASGYRSTLLSDDRVNVYSTNYLSEGVQCVYEPYTSMKCQCMVKDIACVCCGLVVGYHVEQPCERCLRDENNGHMWMFSEKQTKVMREDRKSGVGMMVSTFERCRGKLDRQQEPER